MNDLNFQMKNSTGIFVSQNSNLYELDKIPGVGSINDIAAYVGYLPNQYFTYSFGKKDKSNINEIIFEKFSGKVIAIITKKGIKTITESMILDYLTNFNLDEEFDICNCIDTIEEGINDGSIDFNFLNRVLILEEITKGEKYLSKKWLLNFTFENNKLVGYGYSDGIEKWTRYFKQLNPDLYQTYFNHVKYYRGNDINNILNEINIQFHALANLTNGFRNEFIPLHTQNGIVNYFMILVCHYDLQISLEDFLFINYGRYELFEENAEDYVYILNNFIYIFSKDGTLVGFTQK